MFSRKGADSHIQTVNFFINPAKTAPALTEAEEGFWFVIVEDFDLWVNRHNYLIKI